MAKSQVLCESIQQSSDPKHEREVTLSAGPVRYQFYATR